MSVFAPEEAMSDSGNHPPLEELAAYIDGLLPEAEAARVAEHISECEDCFFVYSETVRFQLEHPEEAEDPAPEPGKVVPFPEKAGEPQRRKRFPWWVGPAIAAVLVLAVGFFLYRSLNPQGMPEMTTAELIAPLQGAPELQSHLYSPKTFRGHNGESDFDRQSFMVGVLLTDLRVSLEARDRAGAASRIQRIGKVLEDALEGSGSGLFEEAQRVESEGDLAATLAKLEQWEKSAGESEDEGASGDAEEVWLVDPAYVSFGKWAEAARLAAVLREEEFFSRRENRRVLSYVLRGEEITPDENVLAHLQEIQSLWDKGNLQPQDFDALAGKFKSVLGAYNFTS